MAEEQQQPIRVNWDGVQDIPVIFANVFLIQHTHAEFYLVFGHVDPPFTGQPTQEQIDQLVRTGIKAKPIIKLALPPQRMVELLQLINAQLGQFQKGQKQ